MCANACHRSSVADLLLAARSGDRSAGDELIVRYAGLVNATVARFRLQESDRADVVQSTWLRLLVHSATIRDPEKIAGWLTTTAKREALAVIRRSRQETASESAGDGVAASHPSPEDVVILAETRAAVRAAVDGLGGRRRLLVDALFYDAAQTYEDASHHAGMPVGSIGPTRGRILRELHRRLDGPESMAS